MSKDVNENLTLVGVKKKVDNLGRILIPKDIRKYLKIKSGTELNITLDKDKIVIARDIKECLSCGKKSNLSVYNNLVLCDNCSKKIAKSVINSMQIGPKY